MFMFKYTGTGFEEECYLFSQNERGLSVGEKFNESIKPIKPSASLENVLTISSK